MSTLGLGQIVDTSLYIPHPDEKIKNNPELKFLEREGLIKFLTEYPKEPSKEEKAKISVAKAENENKDKLSDIKSSSSLTFLEDIIDNSDDVNEVRAAMIRLQQIDGDMIENPEIKQNNPII